MPGDYIQASTYIPQAKAGDGDGLLSAEESVQAFQQLAASGYLRCSQCTGGETDDLPDAANSLTNNYGGVMSIWNDGHHYQVRGGTVADAATGLEVAVTNTELPPRLQVHTGPRIPSSIIAEVDRKIDDGNSNTGDMFFNKYDPTSNNTQVPDVAECTSDPTGSAQGAAYTDGTFTTTLVAVWRAATMTPPVWQNCGAGVFI